MLRAMVGATSSCLLQRHMLLQQLQAAVSSAVTQQYLTNHLAPLHAAFLLNYTVQRLQLQFLLLQAYLYIQLLKCS
jgi:hypothetical protein